MGPSAGDLFFGLQECGKNFAMGIPPIRSIRLHSNRNRTSSVADEALLDRFAFQLPKLLLSHFGSLVGKDIIEIGPGDHLATGLTLLALGARSYTTLDRLTRNYATSRAREWYALVQDKFSATFSQPWPKTLSHETFPGTCGKVKTLPRGIEDLGDCARYDIVCSHAVAEHVSSVLSFAQAHTRLLRESGQALHVVDFGGHQWLRHSDEMLFTRVPAWAWSIMGSNRGYPNRVLFPDFKAILEAADLNVRAINQIPYKAALGVQEATFLLSRKTTTQAHS